MRDKKTEVPDRTREMILERQNKSMVAKLNKTFCEGTGANQSRLTKQGKTYGSVQEAMRI